MPFDIRYANLIPREPELRDELFRVFQPVLDSGQFILGPEVSAFEQWFAEYCGAKHAVGVASGTAALELTLEAFGVSDGDEVITAPNSYIASASAIARVGGRPVFADVGADMNLDPAAIEEAITPRTRGVVPVHLTGRPARMPEIIEIAARHQMFVLEDAAQAVGAQLEGCRVGSWGRAAAFSLHPLKNLHAFGDAGIVTTNDSDLAGRLVPARSHGLRDRNTCEFWGGNERLDALQAAFLRIQAGYLETWTEERRRLAFRYNAALASSVTVPVEGAGERHVYQTYAIQCDRRDDLQKHLRANGVEAIVHYPTPIHRQPAARSLGYGPDAFPVVSQQANRILSLPLYPGLMTSDQDRVIELITEFYG
jgi:dTDP-4-amino-4,6-dideoxygalactose transaminase